MKKTIVAALLLLLMFCLLSCGSGTEVTTEEMTAETTTIQQTIEKVVADNGAFIEGGSFSADTKMIFTSITSESEISKAFSTIEDDNVIDGADIHVFELKLVSDSQELTTEMPLTISVPVSAIGLKENATYLLYSFVDGKADLIDYSETGNTISFSVNSLSTFVMAERHVHDYGQLTVKVPATFLHEGTLAHYQCKGCGKYFDINKNELTSLVIPKLTSELKLSLNGVFCSDLVCTESDSDHIIWTSKEVTVHRDDQLTLSEKDNDSVEYDYVPDVETNITEYKRIHNNADAVITVEYTDKGFLISVSGRKEDGVFLRVTDKSGTRDIQMYYYEYTDDERLSSYFYGYYQFYKGDSFVVADNYFDDILGYEDLTNALLLENKYFTVGEDGSIKIIKDIKMGIGMRPYNGKLFVDPIFAPNYGQKFQLEFKGDDSKIQFDSVTINLSDTGFFELSFMFDYLKIENMNNVLEYIGENGISVFLTTVHVSAGEQIRIYDKTSKKYIDSEHLIGYLDDDESFEIGQKGYIKLYEEGVYIVMYLPYVDSIYIINCNYFTLMEPTFEKNSRRAVTNIPSMRIDPENEDEYEEFYVYLTKGDFFAVWYNYYPYSDIAQGNYLVKKDGYFAEITTNGYYIVRFNIKTKMINLKLVTPEEKVPSETWSIACIYKQINDNGEVEIVKQVVPMTLENGIYKCEIDIPDDATVFFIRDTGTILYSVHMDYDSPYSDRFEETATKDRFICTQGGSYKVCLTVLGLTVNFQENTEIEI